MAIRPGFTIKDGKIISVNANFDWSGGFALSQKQKNISKLHAALGKPSLEVSTKSTSEIGRRLSAFMLTLDGFTLENVFQSSKVFEEGGPFADLLYVNPREAKRDSRLRESGKLTGFFYRGESWPLVPRTAFYDFIYMQAVRECADIEDLKKLEDYTFFTDIEFNPKKSINTQARAIVIIKMLLEMYGGEIPKLDKDIFIEFHKSVVLY